MLTATEPTTAPRLAPTVQSPARPAAAAVLAVYRDCRDLGRLDLYVSGYLDAHRGRSTFTDVALGVATAYLTIMEDL